MSTYSYKTDLSFQSELSNMIGPADDCVKTEVPSVIANRPPKGGTIYRSWTNEMTASKGVIHLINTLPVFHAVTIY